MKILNFIKEKSYLYKTISRITTLYTNKGEILGAPDLGLDLEDNLFNFNMPFDFISQKFYAQLAKYVPEVVDFKIDIDYDIVSNINSKIVNIYISINNNRELGLSLS